MKLSYSVVKDLFLNFHSFDVSLKTLVKQFVKDKPAIRSYIDDLKHDVMIEGDDEDIDRTSYKKGLIELSAGLQRKFTITPVDPARQMPWDYEVYSTEVGYAGITGPIFVGSISIERQTISPTHGYYAPHPTGKKLKKFAENINFKFKD